MRPDLYLIVTGLSFNLPQQPRYLPVIPNGSTSATTSGLVWQNKLQNTQFGITKSRDDSLKQKILAASQNDYVEVLANENVGFS